MTPETTPAAADQKEYHLGPRFTLQQIETACSEAATYYEANTGHVSAATVVDLYRVAAKLAALVTEVIDDTHS
jgi:hypothetical protein